MKKTKLLYIIFLLYPIIDLLTALETRYVSFPITAGIVFRSLFIFALFFYVVFISKDKYRSFNVTYLVILILFSIGYILTHMSASIVNLFQEMAYLFKVFSFPLITVALIEYFHEYGINKKELKHVLRLDALIFLLLLVIPFITNTGFSTYPVKYELMGKMGYFFAANEISAIMVLLFPLLYLNIDDKSRWWLIVIIIYAFVTLYIGTKVVLLGVLLVSLIIFIRSLFMKRNRVIYLIALISIISLAYLSPSYKNIVDRRERIDDTIAINETSLLAMNDRTTDDTSYKDIVISGRTDYLKSNHNIFKSSTMRYQLFGIGVSKYANLCFVEMDYFDIFYRVGILGLVVYLIPFGFMLLLAIKNIKKILKTIIPALTICLGLSIALMSGHVITSPAVSIYLALAIILFFSELKLFNINESKKKIMYISTTGGHLKEMLNLKKLFKKYDSYIVTEKTDTTMALRDNYPHVDYILFGSDRHHLIAYGLRLLANCFISLFIYLKVRPTVIISTGAHFSGPMLCIGKLLGSKIIFIETLANTTDRSKTGNLIYQFADLFIVQWDSMTKVYKKAIKRGGIK